MRVLQAMYGVPISALAKSPGSWEHSAEIWFVVRSINNESYTSMSKLYPHARMCNRTSFYAMLIHALPPVHRPKGVLLVPSITIDCSPGPLDC